MRRILACTAGLGDCSKVALLQSDWSRATLLQSGRAARGRVPAVQTGRVAGPAARGNRASVSVVGLDGRDGSLAKRQRCASWSSNHRFTGSPQRNPPSDPSLRSTRWHGTNSAAALRAHADAAARTAAGRPTFAAYSV